MAWNGSLMRGENPKNPLLCSINSWFVIPMVLPWRKRKMIQLG
nr:hypothetical protein Q903MT_gene2626 [Picea sitchensis]